VPRLSGNRRRISRTTPELRARLWRCFSWFGGNRRSTRCRYRDRNRWVSLRRVFVDVKRNEGETLHAVGYSNNSSLNFLGNQREGALQRRQVQVSVSAGRARVARCQFHCWPGQNFGHCRRIWMRQKHRCVSARTVLRSVYRGDCMWFAFSQSHLYSFNSIKWRSAAYEAPSFRVYNLHVLWKLR